MSISRLKFFIVTFVMGFFSLHSISQDSLLQSKAHHKAKEINRLTISYSLLLKSNKSNTGIGEAYNGGVKTIFIDNHKARVRLVSLMRMQSVFIMQPGNPKQAAVITKESGKDKYKYNLTAEQWKRYYRKYDSVSCELTDDSTVILNYPCRKAIIRLKDGRSMEVFYTDSVSNKMLSKVEPAFSCIPGLVLQYEYKQKKGSVVFTATSITDAYIDPGVFKAPAKGFVARKFYISSSQKPGNKIEEEPDQDADQENDQ